MPFEVFPTPDPLPFLFRWATTVADALNRDLAPGGRFAAEVSCRTRAKFDEALASGAAPAPTFSATARFTDRFGVDVLDSSDGRRLVAAVLLATPDNKLDSDSSLAFAVRVAGLIGAGAGVVVVDAVPGAPSWATHLHSLTPVIPIARRARKGECSVLVVKPCVRGGAETLDVWSHLVEVGAALPTVPLPLAGAELKLDLEACLADARSRG
jgi:hypothetical protein